MKWIPINDKKPEFEKKVLIFTNDGEINCAYRTNVAWTTDEYEYIIASGLGYKYSYDENKVLAWANIPMPYKSPAELALLMNTD